MGAFVRSSTHYCTFEKRWDSDGKVWIQAQAHGTLVAKTPYQIIVNEFGNISAAVSDVESYTHIGCPQAAASSEDILWFQIGGYIADMVCSSDTFAVGDGIKKFDATVVSVDADFTGAVGEFAVAAELVAQAATAVNAMLVPERVKGAT